MATLEYNLLEVEKEYNRGGNSPSSKTITVNMQPQIQCSDLV